MIEITYRAKRDFSFDVIGTERIGRMNSAGAKTEINRVAGLAKVGAAVKMILPEN